ARRAGAPLFSGRKSLDRRRRGNQLAAVIGALLQLHLAFGETPWTDQDLPGNSDQVSGGEFCARTLLEIIIEHFDASLAQRAVELLTSRIGFAATLFEVENSHCERRNALRPYNSGIIVRGFDNCGDQPARSDPVGPHV